MATLAATTITIAVPISLCPMSLSKNGRAHWRVRHHDFQGQKEFAYWHIYQSPLAPCPHWEHAVMHLTWQYNRGRPPDDDNCWARVSAVRDAFELAGVVTDDRNIRIGTLTFERVPRWDDPMAIVRLERG